MSAVRGVRQTLPPNTMTGRIAGSGAAQPVPMAQLAQALAQCPTPLATAAGNNSAVAAETSRAKAAESTLTAAVAAETARAEAAEALLAPKANPVFTGTVTASLFPQAANDTAAAAAGVGIGQIYVNGSMMMQRQS